MKTTPSWATVKTLFLGPDKTKNQKQEKIGNDSELYFVKFVLLFLKISLIALVAFWKMTPKTHPSSLQEQF